MISEPSCIRILKESPKVNPIGGDLFVAIPQHRNFARRLPIAYICRGSSAGIGICLGYVCYKEAAPTGLGTKCFSTKK